VPGTIGQVMPSMEYKLLHPETLQPLGEDEPGLLVVRGPNVFNGYLEDDVKSPFILLDKKEWYNTGDLVRRNERGGLTFCGRLQRFVNLGGEMISLPAIEETLAAALEWENIPVEGDTPLMAVEAINPDTNPMLVLFSRVPLEREHVNQMIRDAGLSPLHNIRQIRLVEEIPLLGSGKINYRALREILQR
jgi:long-chain-fatty-acid--[acyl-carrier-protein] ligase